MFLSLLFLACSDSPEPELMVEMECYNESQTDAEGKKRRADACFKLGTELLNSPRPDYAEARRLLSTACSIHHAQACNALGTLVRDARGGPRDYARAADLFEVACENGVPQACIHYADALRTGLGVEKDEEAALALYEKACSGENSIPAACTRLAVGLKKKRGATREDRERADALLEKACAASYPKACVVLADEAKKKWGKEQLARAAELYETACAIDPHFGCYELAEMHIRRKAPDANDEQAAHYYQQVCRIDTQRGCYELAELMDAGKVPARPGEKEALYKVACESGNSDACAKR